MDPNIINRFFGDGEPRSIIIRLPDEAHGRLVDHCRSREVSPEAFVTEAILEKLGAAA